MVCRAAEVVGLAAFALKGPGQRLGVAVVAVVLGGMGRVGVWADGEDSSGYQGICKCQPCYRDIALIW